MATYEGAADISMVEQGEEVSSSIPSTSLSVQLLNQLLASRRDRYRALRASGQAGGSIVFHQPSQAQNGKEGPGEGANGESKSAVRTTHMVLRILGLSFIVPMVTLSDDGLPKTLDREGFSVKAALETMAKALSMAKEGTRAHRGVEFLPPSRAPQSMHGSCRASSPQPPSCMRAAAVFRTPHRTRTRCTSTRT
ncbi:hypothetical protein FA10DRAFT_101002 [Acaromyces ingoldii]|uniref:Uncharacterized protein n=1 Tax=Acaromyces ingoldii TaxID=215250 RepID=A0A316YKJ2_9BASI|nr:hypothetical protein FA10DRAFT_101002 [Acaromyces ingoldii]PWN89947.1 hypothetical protein FA10DRAFT_101002 [Acaromyces ingoldii]